MNKKLYIHIGGKKTGTTALQVFLAKNRQVLETLGFCYPGSEAGHWDICSDIRNHPPGKTPVLSGSALSGYLTEIQRSPCHTAILSGECLSFQGGARHLRELIPRSLPVTIIYYARRQDELIESHYNQTVKSRFRTIKNRLDEEYLEEIYTENLCDHPHVIGPWAEAFGKENIIVRCYEKQQMRGDIIGDFSSVVGLFIKDTSTDLKKLHNLRMDAPHTEFIRLCNNAFPDAVAISKFLQFNGFHNSRLFANRQKQYLLSPGTRREILRRFEESNQQLAREYLGRADGRLFYEPFPDPDETWEPYNGLALDEIDLILDELITNIDAWELEPLAGMLVRLNRVAKIFTGIVPGTFPEGDSDNGRTPGTIMRPFSSSAISPWRLDSRGAQHTVKFTGPVTERDSNFRQKYSVKRLETMKSPAG